MIGQALLAKVAGAGQRTLATRLGRPRETVRNWLRAFAARAGEARRHFLAWALALARACTRWRREAPCSLTLSRRCATRPAQRA